MKQYRYYKFLIVLFIMTCMVILQGCSLKEAETSRKVTLSEDGSAIDVVLKADESQNYEWKYITRSNVLFESNSNVENDVFSNTYIKKYRFTINDTNPDSLILALVQNGDLENARVYEYQITADESGNPVIADPVERNLKLNPDILSALQSKYGN